jgi:hypothetical protein
VGGVSEEDARILLGSVDVICPVFAWGEDLSIAVYAHYKRREGHRMKWCKFLDEMRTQVCSAIIGKPF